MDPALSSQHFSSFSKTVKMQISEYGALCPVSCWTENLEPLKIISPFWKNLHLKFYIFFTVLFLIGK